MCWIDFCQTWNSRNLYQPHDKIECPENYTVCKTSSELKHTRIILGGPEVRNHSEKFLRYGADVIVVGEGEETMLELVTHFTENKSGEADSTNGLKTISGISFIDSEKMQ